MYGIPDKYLEPYLIDRYIDVWRINLSLEGVNSYLFDHPEWKTHYPDADGTGIYDVIYMSPVSPGGLYLQTETRMIAVNAKMCQFGMKDNLVCPNQYFPFIRVSGPAISGPKIILPPEKRIFEI